MAYINREKSAAIRQKLQREFPARDGWKFSVTIEHCSSLNVAIMQSPLMFDTAKGRGINHYYLDDYEHSDILKRITRICNDGNHDKSDLMTDYFDVGWYFSLSVGKWDKPCVFVKPRDLVEVGA